MLALFLLMLIFGGGLLVFGVRQMRLVHLSKKFMHLYMPSQSKKKPVVLRPSKVAYFFRNIYTKEHGIQKKGFIVLVVCFGVLFVANTLLLEFSLIVVGLAAILCGAVVSNVLHQRALRNDFDKNFPELIVILNGAISSGSNITQALHDCTNLISGILQQELKIITKALSIGDDPKRVFEASYERLPFENYYFFLMVLLVSLNSGAKLKEMLSRLAIANTRAKTIEKKKNAMTSEARMSAKITAAIPFVFLFLTKFISPENFDFIIHDERGRYILYYFLASECIGVAVVMFLMRKI